MTTATSRKVKTEVERFHGEWKTSTLGHVCERITTGKLDANAMVEDGEFPFFTCAKNHYWIDKYAFDSEALLISGNGANVGYIHYYSGKFNAYQRTYVLSGFRENIHFLEWFIGLNLQNRIQLEVKAGNTPYITMDTLFDMTVKLPTLSEQRAIVKALSDVDELIDSLEALIAKKRDMKQGAMQQLLTGKTRLPGFDGEWEVKTLGDTMEKLVGGGTPSRSISTYWGGSIPWATVKDFATFTPYATQESITDHGLNNSSTNLIPKDTLITSTRMALGKTVIYSIPIAINQDLKAVFLKKEYFARYVYYWFEWNRKKIEMLGGGSTVKGISIEQLRTLSFQHFSLEEQHAIASILSDMDAEIEALEKRKAKTIYIKQGMMQELLTGKTRLPKRESA